MSSFPTFTPFDRRIMVAANAMEAAANIYG
jgi:hypothetical protein